MRRLAAAACVLAALAVQAEEAYDVVVYGSTPAALTAAIEAGRHGRSAVIVCPETRIGGLTTGGLGETDIGNKAAFGGLALEFYKDVARYYSNPDNLVVQFPDERRRKAIAAGIRRAESKWTFEPSVALSILEGWEKRHGLDIRRGEWLDRERGVEKKDGRIVSIRTLSGRVYRGKVFVDATYEGDLMAAAGVSYHVGREANSVYGETLNGNEPGYAKFHQLNKGIDPYVVPGDPKSGLLPGVEPHDPSFKPGDGDRRVQAYCLRMCLTDNPANRIPFAKPEGYDERDYELLFRHLAIGPLDRNGMPWINSRMPNRKTDTNNRTGFSTDFIGQSWKWPEASYAEREKILAAHLKYQKGLMWTLANHPRVPEKIRKEVSRWGTCRDEFKDGFGDGWQRQLYVREARRMVGEYVMTEANCRGRVVAPRPVAMGAYTMDSHHVRRYVTAEGHVRNEGDVEVGADEKGRRFPPYPIDYGAIVPKRAECLNLFVPVCLSASHIAFGSIRMEPVFFALGQAAGAAASIAAADGVAVQDVPYGKLRRDLAAAGQVLRLP
ncbi:MAG: FAD-dependent oxidoreductase [Kiritimatiellae bacterium]|nr:FAD-dependent oxidoreductase [Kiritimatiellia bacterium]